MFRDMRRGRQALPKDECNAVLLRGTSGVLALSGDDGYPYAVPISYVYAPEDARIYFHCAKTGHKIDAIARSDKASFCVIDEDQVVPKGFTTYFRSVIAFGRIGVIDDDQKRRLAIERLGRKYFPTETDEALEDEVSRTWQALCMLEMRIEHLSGKEAIELRQQADDE
jgi:nitroimidazol reductase NimA-like FMN-containing flavoprotein (pyridoxamine 5'-phosphate oxidase superfamily)